MCIRDRGEVFLGREFSQAQDYSQQTAVEIDQEVRRLVMENYERAKQVIIDNLEKLKAIAEALLEYETIDTDDIDLLVSGGKIARKPIVASKKEEPAAKDKAARPSPLFPTPRPKEEPEPA